MEKIFFNCRQSIIRTLMVAIIPCFAVIFILRILGKQTVPRMNAFGFLITVALGSSFAAAALNNNVPLADGILLIFLIVLLQYTITAVSVSVKAFKNMITISPALLFYKGRIIPGAMKKERIITEELFLATRQKGYARIEGIDAIVLEPTDILPVVPNLPESGHTTLSNKKKPYLTNNKEEK